MALKTRSYGIPGEYEILTADGQPTGYDIRRCAWNNADRGGINSPRPAWLIERQSDHHGLHLETTKKDALAWAEANLDLSV